MKLLSVPAKEMMSLSKTADLKWTDFCLKMKWGSAFHEEDHYIPVLQPTIGHLLFYLHHNKIEYLIMYLDKEPLLILWNLVKMDLES